MKKKLIAAILGLLMPAMMMAQIPGNSLAEGCIHLTAQNSEIFMVYVDGQPYGDLAQQGLQRQYILSNMAQGLHDITVRLVRPVDRVAHITVEYIYAQHQDYLVSYSPREDRLRIMTSDGTIIPTPYTPGTQVGPSLPAHNGGHYGNNHHHEQNDVHDANNRHYKGHHHATDSDVRDIIDRMRKVSFASDRMNLAKTFVKGKAIRTQHAIQMAQEFSFDSDKLEFLLFAYRYCVDPENYYKTTDVLSFSSNKKQLLKAIK